MSTAGRQVRGTKTERVCERERVSSNDTLTFFLALALTLTLKFLIFINSLATIIFSFYPLKAIASKVMSSDLGAPFAKTFTSSSDSFIMVLMGRTRR